MTTQTWSSGYGRREFRSLFGHFRAAKSSIDHLTPEDFAFVGERISQRWLDRLARHFGWYVIVEAIK